MKTHSFFTTLLCCGAALSFTSLRADTLGEILEKAELGALIGTWVDPDSQGEQITLTYAWRIKDHALGMTAKTSNRTSEALIGVNPKTGEVVHTTVDSKGGAGLGTWGEEDGVATLTLTVVDAEGEERNLKITHKIVENKNLVVGMKNADTDEGGEITLVRKTE